MWKEAGPPFKWESCHAWRSGFPSSSAVRVTFSSHRQSSTDSVAVTAACATSPLSQTTSKKKNWTCDSGRRDQGAATCLAKHPQRSGVQQETKAPYSLFDIEGGFLKPPPSTAGSHGFASAKLARERIAPPKGAGFLIMPKLGDAVWPSAIFQPSLPLPVPWDCYETASIHRRLAPRQTGTPFVPQLASSSFCLRGKPVGVRRGSRSIVYAEACWKRTVFSLGAEMSDHATFPQCGRATRHKYGD